MIRVIVLCVLALCLRVGSLTAAEPAGGLSPEQIQNLINSVELDGHTRAAMNAVTNNDIKDLTLNREIAAVNDDIFSFKLPTKGITDQESTGRCWLFAGLNILRQRVIDKYKLDDFEFSQSYLAFWDKLEKANVFLEFIIETRERDVLDREVYTMLDDPVGDGGYWSYVANIVGKYGVLPKKFMDETKSSANTGRMDDILTTLLRRDAARLRGAEMQGRSVAQLRSEKLKMLEDVVRVLVINYGLPPKDFEWRTAPDSGAVSEPVRYTPQKFYTDVVGIDLADYVSLVNYPVHDFDKGYSIKLTRSMADKPDNSFVNVDGSTMKSCALKALLDSNRIWFGCDVGHDVHSKKGLMAKGLFDYEDLFGINLDMTKAERLNYRQSSSNHAMLLVGVDLKDKAPRRWRVENSWGTDRGDGGYFVMSDDWFDENVLNVIVPKKYLPETVLAALKQPPTPLPVWDPVWKSLGW